MNTYDVVPADISAELPGYFPGGFSATTLPKDDQVADAISTADTIITLVVQDFVGEAPSVDDRAAGIAKRYIIEWVKAWVIRVILAGRPPVDIAAVAGPFAELAAQMRQALVDLGAQAIGTGESSPRVLTSLSASGLPARDLLITDADLDPASRGRF